MFYRVILFLCLISVTTFFSVNAYALSIQQYFPANQNYNNQIITPEKVLGFGLGERHPRHDQIVSYFQQLSVSSNRVKLTEMGLTPQYRKQLLVTISSPENLANLDDILAERHISEQNKKRDNSNNKTEPLVVWLGYSVHGDEASGANAAMAIAYYYAALTSPENTELLENTIIVLEPNINPDGFDRFVNWVSTYRNDAENDDPNHSEHRQGWVTGRTNHYWFDLNRDWLLLTQQESQQRIGFFHQYQPHVVGDFHEMSRNSSYFFQPGVESRTHPLTPKKNITLTGMMAKYHAEALDAVDHLYYSKEVFDDFYYGKGSTYPDINGSLGILFEQATSHGMRQQSENGVVTLELGIQNHVLTSLSTIKGAWENRQTLQDYRISFYRDALKLAKNESFHGYLIHANDDKEKLQSFLTTLQMHQINVYPLTADYRLNNKTFAHEKSYFIPLAQTQYKVIKALFNQQKNFEDNTFYDVSGWTLPLAMNIEFHQVERKRGLKVANTVWQQPASGVPLIEPNSYAYVFEWHHALAPQLLDNLLSAGIKAKVANKGFSSSVNGVEYRFKPGSILLAAGWQNIENWHEIVANLSAHSQIEIFSVASGLTEQGIDFGSASFKAIVPPKVLLIGGEGVSEYEAGEMRFYLDNTLDIPLSVIEQHRISTVDLSLYTHIILVDGDYRKFSNKTSLVLSKWVKEGGVLYGQKRAAKWLADKEMLMANFYSTNQLNQLFDTDDLAYQDRDKLDARKRIAGAIFETELDVSHPLTYGFLSKNLPIFRNSNIIMKRPTKPFISIANYTSQPLMSGYTDNNLEKTIAHNTPIIAHSYGKGRVIASTDNLAFRGYWLDTAKIISNSLFFAKAFDTPVK